MQKRLIKFTKGVKFMILQHNLILPVMASSIVTDHQEINQAKGKYIKELEEQVEQKTQSINTLFEEKKNLNKLLEDTLEKMVGTQHLVETRKILWDQIIHVMDQFIFHLELHQHCETITIKNAQLDISNHLPDIEKKIPQAKRIIEFMNSLSDQDLKSSRVRDRFEAVSNVTNVIEKGELLKSLVKKIEEVHQSIIKFKRQFRKIESLVFHIPGY
jgi:hypothetical protein